MERFGRPTAPRAIAGSGTAGWGLGTEHEADGIFFRYRITGAAFSPT